MNVCLHLFCFFPLKTAFLKMFIFHPKWPKMLFTWVLKARTHSRSSVAAPQNRLLTYFWCPICHFCSYVSMTQNNQTKRCGLHNNHCSWNSILYSSDPKCSLVKNCLQALFMFCFVLLANFLPHILHVIWCFHGTKKLQISLGLNIVRNHTTQLKVGLDNF